MLSSQPACTLIFRKPCPFEGNQAFRTQFETALDPPARHFLHQMRTEFLKFAFPFSACAGESALKAKCTRHKPFFIRW